MAGLAAMKRKIAGQACTALGDVSGPCVEQFVPNPGKGESADVTLSSNAAVTVPVYGVPVKVGEGASVKLSRKDKKYTMTETGEGLGGLPALLSAQGLSHALPPPFSAMTGLVAESFGENVTSCVVTLAQYGNASVNVKQDGLGGLEAAIKAQSSAALERTKDEKEGWIATATLQQSLGVSGAAKLATGGTLP